MAKLDGIDTIVILMFENRSFDHLLGHLSLKEPRLEVEGLHDLDTDPVFANIFKNMEFTPFLIQDETAVITHDLPHSRAMVSTQMAEVHEKFRMWGFVQAYIEATQQFLGPLSPPMGYFDEQGAWMSSFLAREFCVCDHWFAPLPTDTQPNRLMAFTGTALTDDTRVRILNDRDLVFDWLSVHGIRWRVYHDGLPFFALFGRVGEVLGPRFCPIDRLANDIQTEPPDAAPQVIFIEPRYFDHFLSDLPSNCNHPLGRLCNGELYLHRVYSALTSNPAKWARTVFIVTYDEPGGFFDHVPPLRIVNPAPLGADYTEGFTTTGPRVPAIIASPWVNRGKVFSGQLDHTSILQLIAEKFSTGPAPYSSSVNDRRQQGIRSVSEALDDEVTQRPAPQRPPRACPPLRPGPRIPRTPNEFAFMQAAQKLKAEGGDAAVEKFPSLARLPP